MLSWVVQNADIILLCCVDMPFLGYMYVVDAQTDRQTARETYSLFLKAGHRADIVRLEVVCYCA